MLRLLPFCILLLFSTPEISFGQVQLDANGNVALGTTVTQSAYRVHILSGSNSMGLNISSPLSGSDRIGLNVLANGGSNKNQGIYARGSAPVGVSTVYGVYGDAVNGQAGFGIYGKASGQSGASYAGYFNGNVAVLGNFINPSDAKLKERSQPLVPADVLSRLMQLVPKSYYFRTSAEYAHMGLPSTLQYGLIAQEVEAIFPELVRDEVQPPPLDDEGREVGASIAFKSVDYLKLIPLLVAALQEQQRRIAALEAAR